MGRHEGQTNASFSAPDRSNDFYISQWLFLRLLGIVYFIAFASLYVQLPTLYGRDGILPVEVFLKERSLMPETFKVSAGLFWTVSPTLLWFSGPLGISVDVAMHALSLAALFGSFLMTIGASWTPLLAFLWLAYLSFCSVGQAFLSFQWDVLLLETGFIAILLGNLTKPFAVGPPERSSSSENPCYFLLRFLIRHHWIYVIADVLSWLLFKLLFASALVKLNSGCPSWWSLTAMEYHHMTTCLPNPLSALIHHAPTWTLRFQAYLTFVTELMFPLTTFVPWSRSLRLLNAILSMVFQVGIQLAGNYGFFNLLSAILAISLIDDQFILHFIPSYWNREKRVTDEEHSRKACAPSVFSDMIRIVDLYTLFAALFAIGFVSFAYFGLQIDFYNLKEPLKFTIKFSPRDWQTFTAFAVPMTVYAGAISLFVFVVSSAFNIETASVLFVHSAAVYEKLVLDSHRLTRTVPEASRHLASFMPLSFEHYILPILSHLRIASSYGLFARMTTTRPEVIISVSDDGKFWEELNFHYKVGNISRTPPLVAPHQPRVDWQMWFAALSNPERHPWFANLLVRILQPHGDVGSLFVDPPFTEQRRMKYVKADLYDYRYADDDIWLRKFQRSYFPPISLEAVGVQRIADNLDQPSSSDHIINGTLAWMRVLHYASSLLPSVVGIALVILALIIFFPSTLQRRRRAVPEVKLKID